MTFTVILVPGCAPTRDNWVVFYFRGDRLIAQNIIAFGRARTSFLTSKLPNRLPTRCTRATNIAHHENCTAAGFQVTSSLATSNIIIFFLPLLLIPGYTLHIA